MVLISNSRISLAQAIAHRRNNEALIRTKRIFTFYWIVSRFREVSCLFVCFVGYQKLVAARRRDQHPRRACSPESFASIRACRGRLVASAVPRLRDERGRH